MVHGTAAKVAAQEKEQIGKHMKTDGKESLVEEIVATWKGIPTEQELREWLTEETLTVTFTKLNGDERIMTCTKSFDIIPEDKRPKTNSEPKTGTITVWDVNANDWRSFRYDRVKNVEVFDEETK